MTNQVETLLRIETAMMSIRQIMLRGQKREFPSSVVVVMKTLSDYYRNNSTPLTTGELTGLVHILSPASITSALDILEKRHLITREPDLNDRRTIKIIPSRKLRGIMKMWQTGNRARRHKFAADQLTEMLDYLGEEDSVELMRLIERIAEYFREKSDRIPQELAGNARKNEVKK